MRTEKNNKKIGRNLLMGTGKTAKDHFQLEIILRNQLQARSQGSSTRLKLAKCQTSK